MKVDLPKETLKDIQKVGDEAINTILEQNFKTVDQKDEQERSNEDIRQAYLNIIDLLKDYCDLKEEYYPLIATWIIGTYMHNDFQSYPYLFLNAMRGSGKTRTLKLISRLAWEGELQASLTEAVLFRTTGTLGLDEFEGVTRKGGENLRELLNAAYKKGTKVKRMRQKNTPEGMEQVVEEFNAYRPIAMANIWGMEEVLGDRCITLVLERSNNPKIVKKVEIYEDSEIFKKTKELLKGCSLCSVVVARKVYVEWNNYITNNYIYTQTTHTTQNNINYTKLFKRLNSLNMNGRDLELTMPLLLISYEIGEKAFENVFSAITNYINEKKDDQFAESKDVSLIDFISQSLEEWISVKQLSQNFKEFMVEDSDDWINPKWIGRALKRLNLIKNKKRLRGGVTVFLDVTKAQEKIKMFK